MIAKRRENGEGQKIVLAIKKPFELNHIFQNTKTK